MIFRGRDKQEVPDCELLQKFRTTHNLSYLGDLFNRYSHLVYGISLNYLKNHDESKDAVFEIFDKLSGFSFDKDILNFKAWLLSLTKNYCIDKLRKQKRDKELINHYDFAGDDSLVVENCEYERLLNENENELKLLNLEKGIEELSEEQKVCIKLFYFEDKSYKEIFEITGYSLKEFKSFIQNGKRNLRNFLTRQNVEFNA